MIHRRDLLLGMGAMLASRQLMAADRPLDVAYVNAQVWTGQRDVPLAGAIGLSGNRVAVDWPVAPIDPLLGVAAAVLRRTIDGANPSGWVPQERIAVQEALTAYTTSNAHDGFQEDRLGLIAPGYLADLAILDTDLTRCAPEQIERAKVLGTLVDGEVRFGSDRT